MIIKNNNNILYEADNIFVPKRDCPIEINKKETYIVKYYLNKEIILKKINFMIFKKIYLIIILKKLIGNQLMNVLIMKMELLSLFLNVQLKKILQKLMKD